MCVCAESPAHASSSWKKTLIPNVSQDSPFLSKHPNGSSQAFGAFEVCHEYEEEEIGKIYARRELSAFTARVAHICDRKQREHRK